MAVRVYASEKPRFDIHILPIDVWEKVTDFLDLRQIQEMHGVCKAFNHVFVELAQIQIKMRLKGTPAKILLENSSILKDAPIPRLHRLIRAAYAGTTGQQLAIPPLQNETSFAGYQSLPVRFRFDGLSIWKFMGSALVHEDQGLIEHLVQRALKGGEPPFDVDCLAMHYLKKNEFDVFKQLLTYTSVYVRDDSDPDYLYRNSPLGDFFREAAKRDIDLFKYLLSLNKLSWVWARALLSDLAQDQQIEAMELLRKHFST